MNDEYALNEPEDLDSLEVSAVQSSRCPSGYISYVISRGQTLWAIAQQFNTTVAAILAANPGLDANLYYEGDTICIPSTTTPQPGFCPNGTPYTVRQGDSFYLIARRYGIALATLLAANPGVEPERLMVGQVICIPVGAAPTCPSGHTTHNVTQGQTFVDILVLYNLSYSALANANANVNLSSLTAGQTLCIPPSGSRGTCTVSGLAPHVIQRGETIASIAAMYGTNPSMLLMANPNLTPTDFVTGRIICLPQGSTTN